MTSQHTIDAAKHALREEMRVRRGSLSAAVRAQGAGEIAGNGLDFIGLSPGAVVAGYAAIRDELDPAQLIASLEASGQLIALPVTVARGKPLAFRRWTPDTELQPGDFSVPVPGTDAPALTPDVLLVPLLAFDLEGYRLGYGAGYYDRTLGELRSRRETLAIGLAFDVQRVETVPHDGYDERLDWVLTPSGPMKIER